MELVGTVTELWRYPVKSMAGEPLERCLIGPRGVIGDRGWALRDEKAREIRGAKKLPASLLRCRPTYLGEPSLDEVPPVEITFPDGTTQTTATVHATTIAQVYSNANSVDLTCSSGYVVVCASCTTGFGVVINDQNSPLPPGSLWLGWLTPSASNATGLHCIAPGAGISRTALLRCAKLQ